MTDRVPRTSSANPRRRWLLLGRSHRRIVHAMSSGLPTHDMQLMLRRRFREALISATVDRPIWSTSLKLRSGRCVAVPLDVLDLAVLLGDDSDERRVAAQRLLSELDERLTHRETGPVDELPAAPVSRRPYSATSVRSVVSGGLPDQTRKRH